MRYIKLPGLLAVAAAALMAFAGSATAASITSSEGTTPNIVATSTNFELDGSIVTVKCSHSKIEGNVESHGGATVGGLVDSLSFTGCNYEVTIGFRGSLAVEPVSPTGNGTVKSTGASISIHSSVGVCTFTTSGTDVGTLTGGSPAVINANSAKIHRTGGNFLCGTYGTLTGSYTVGQPSTLEVH